MFPRESKFRQILSFLKFWIEELYIFGPHQAQIVINDCSGQERCGLDDSTLNRRVWIRCGIVTVILLS